MSAVLDCSREDELYVEAIEPITRGRQMNQENSVLVDREKLARLLSAAEKCWALCDAVIDIDETCGEGYGFKSYGEILRLHGSIEQPQFLTGDRFDTRIEAIRELESLRESNCFEVSNAADDVIEFIKANDETLAKVSP